MTFNLILEGIRTPILNILALTFSLLGEEIVFICVLAVLFWCFSKKTAYKVFFTYITAGSAASILTAAFHKPYLWIADSSFSTLDLVRDNLSGYSFPSYGIFSVTCLAAIIFLKYRNLPARAACIASVLLVSMSYLYLGICTPAGVCTAILIAAFGSFVCHLFIDGTWFDRSQFRLYGLLQLILPFVLICVTFSLYFNDTITQEGMGSLISRCGLYLGLLISWYAESMYIRFSVRCDRAWKQLVKASCGIFSILLIYIGLTLLFSLAPGFLYSGLIRALVTSITGLCIYPVLIKKVFQRAYG